jgi:hypothetical protein
VLQVEDRLVEQFPDVRVMQSVDDLLAAALPDDETADASMCTASASSPTEHAPFFNLAMM